MGSVEDHAGGRPRDAIKRPDRGNATEREITRSYNVSQTTISRLSLNQ
jgi:hypothetical protein